MYKIKQLIFFLLSVAIQQCAVQNRLYWSKQTKAEEKEF